MYKVKTKYSTFFLQKKKKKKETNYLDGRLAIMVILEIT